MEDKQPVSEVKQPKNKGNRRLHNAEGGILEYAATPESVSAPASGGVDVKILHNTLVQLVAAQEGLAADNDVEDKQ
jgi:hypothetical protein